MGHFLWVCWGPVGPCVAADALVLLLRCVPGCCGRSLCCWSPAVVAVSGFSAGFGKIQMNQIIQFAIYLHKVGNADAKCHKIQFQTNVVFFCWVGFAESSAGQSETSTEISLL